jgi:hypothetical protein
MTATKGKTGARGAEGPKWADVDIARIEEKLDGLAETVALRFFENQRAITKAEDSMTSRLEGMNEFRDQLKDQATKFALRDEVNRRFDEVVEDIKSLELSKATLEGKASQGAVFIAYAISAIGIILGIVSMLHG